MHRLSDVRQKGAALLAIIMFVAMLTLMLLSYLIAMQMDQLSTNSYSNSIRAQEIGLGGLQEIISDLYQEIDAGSIPNGAPTGNYTIDGKRIYIPKSNLAAQPVRNSFAPGTYDVTLQPASGTAPAKLPPNLVRVSRAESRSNFIPFSAPVYSTTFDTSKTPVNYASAVSSTNSSANSRILTAERWNKPLMMPDNRGTEAGMQVPDEFKNNPPDWVYVTRGGRKLITSSDVTSGSAKWDSNLSKLTSVVGRYAYVIYDEGALLDINVAGYPSTVGTMIYNDSTIGSSQAIRGKSFVAHADLTQLPGLAGKQAAIDKIVNWRNKGGLALSGNNFLKTVINYAPGGFLNLQQGDNPILGRQDLLNYFNQLLKSGDIDSLTAVQYLGTFSRAVNAPSWIPSANSVNIPGYKAGSGSSPVPYKDDAEKAASANRNIPNVRFASDATIRHYKDNGVTDDYNVVRGDPLVQRRFSLAKLAWLTPHGPSADLPSGNAQYNAGGTAAAIQACFGLKWIPGSGADSPPYWEYVGATGNVGQLAIKTLAQVAGESPRREPNFFELLKAGILSGSLGRDPGMLSTAYDGDGENPASKSFEGVAGMYFGGDPANPGYSEEKDRHIFQIAANIIDQFDADSIPTAIHSSVFDDSSFAVKVENTLYGNENLPYLTRLAPIDGEAPRGKMNMWIRPEIWNPHQVSAATSVPAPTQFRTRAYGQVEWQWEMTLGNTKKADPPPQGALEIYDTAGNPNPAGLVYFTDTTGTSASPFFNRPVMLTKTHLSTVNTTPETNIYGRKTLIPNYPTDNKIMSFDNPVPPPVDKHFIGIWAGDADMPPAGTYVPAIPAAPPEPAVPAKFPWMNYPGTASDPNDWHMRFKMTPTRFTVSLECWDGTYWRPYSFISRLGAARGTEHWNGTVSAKPIMPEPDYTGKTLTSSNSWVRPDPRTDRFSASGWRSGAGFGNPESKPNDSIYTFEPNPTNIFGPEVYFPNRNRGFYYVTTPATPADIGSLTGGAPGWTGVATSGWALNSETVPPFPGGTMSGYFSFYTDPDGVVRPGDSLYRDRATGNGCMLMDANIAAISTSLPARRPVILNRPFRSVGELGYAYRDLPFKTLDFFSPSSGDAALLDLFSVSDEPAVVAGLVNLSNAPIYVIKALLAGSQRQEALATNTVSTGDANAWAAKLARCVTPISATATPLLNRGDLVTKLMNPSDGLVSGLPASPPVDKGNKPYMEASLRAISSISDTRTWNLMIDIIAQSGRIAPNATKPDDFMVEGERRYWLHISIDRYTGAVVDQLLEPVYE